MQITGLGPNPRNPVLPLAGDRISPCRHPVDTL